MVSARAWMQGTGTVEPRIWRGALECCEINFQNERLDAFYVLDLELGVKAFSLSDAQVYLIGTMGGIWVRFRSVERRGGDNREKALYSLQVHPLAEDILKELHSRRSPLSSKFLK